MIADRADPSQAPARRNAARMEEQRLAHRRRVKFLVDDLGDRDGILPILACARDRWQRLAADEAELAALEQDAAIAGWEAAGLSAVGNDMADCKLALQALALGLIIDPDRKAFEFTASSFSAARLRHSFGERRTWRYLRFLDFLPFGEGS